MAYYYYPLLLLVAQLCRAELVAPNALNLRISSNVTHEIPSTLYGYMWEDINHSGDGGLYAELLQNRAFQAVIPGTQNALTAWQPFNGARLAVTAKTSGVSAALPHSLEVQIPKTVAGPIGFENTGYWGIKVQSGWTYTGSFYAKAPAFAGPITVSLKSAAGTVFASTTLTDVTPAWKKFTFELQPAASAPTDENVFSVVVDGKSAAGHTVYFGLFSLFPPTFRGRPNGMRVDLAEALAATRPSVWRFPGGNNIEGASIDTRWKWNETIGRIEDRPGRVGDWGYPNTDGLGLLEYLDWAEDLQAVRIANVTYTTPGRADSPRGTHPRRLGRHLHPELLGSRHLADRSRSGSAAVHRRRAQRDRVHRRESFDARWEAAREPGQAGTVRAQVHRDVQGTKIRQVFQESSYAGYRWNAFVSAIGAKYPKMEFIATSYPTLALSPAYQRIDFHMYNSPDWFTGNAFMFDDYPRNGTKWFIGEYAGAHQHERSEPPRRYRRRATSVPDSAGRRGRGGVYDGARAQQRRRVCFCLYACSIHLAPHFNPPRKQMRLGTTGNCRPSVNDITRGLTRFSPSFQHLKSYVWTPDIISYDASRLIKSTSYYVQQMFSLNRGSHVIATTPSSTNESAPLYWVASYQNDTDVVFLKVSNTGTSDLVANIFLDFNVTSFGSAVSISSPVLSPITGLFNISNTPAAPDQIIPVSSSFALPFPDRFNYSFPATSVTVVSLQAKAPFSITNTNS
ncbi:unnamed protein product [Mycena citricolor]|uniref:non-reducing end alpha-L-arabinofuranosidase n=1 Tax=Mycena citricolor TaxID=2018698 RepID=A0AAD2K717_9AGAR|nr:unnamed protein product [Mycena citricolor]